MRKYFNWLIIKKDYYTPLEDHEYYKNFGIEKDSANDQYKVINKEILEEAYTRAWANRDFEIDKFWTRAAYFWGFIVLIFGGYISVLIGEHSDKAIKMRLDLYLLLLGILFSISWLLVILGSKSWQKNWEAHIDRLEEYISGPLYKTVFYSGNKFYSVSKLNEVMALAVIIAWGGLFIQYLCTHGNAIDLTSVIAIGITLVLAIVLIFGYSSGSYKSTKNKFFNRWE